MGDGNRYDVNCTDGNFTCSASSNCTNIQPVKFVVRDKAFVQPLADVKSVEEYSYSAGENMTEGSTGETGEVNATEASLPEGTNVILEAVESFLSNADGKQVTIFDDEAVTCLLTMVVDEANGTTSFTITNCTDSSYDGNGTVLDENGTVVIEDDDGNINKVVYVDNNALLVNYEEDGDNYTASFVISPANETSNDTELTSYITGSWKYYEYEDETGTWENEGECVTFYDNGTFVWYGSNGTETGNYTVQNGQIVIPENSANRTIINIIDKDTFIMSEIWYTDNETVEDYDNRIWVRTDSCLNDLK
jgi:outer membrane lipoprotein-sorting protein